MKETELLKENGGQIPAELNKMGTMPVGKLLFSMSVPAMFSMLINALYNIVDSVFVGMIGEPALTAVSLVFPVQMLMISVAVGTGVGLSSLISRRLGEKKQAEADSAADHGLILFVISAMVFTVFGLFFSRAFMNAFTANPVVADYGTSYCFIVTVFSVFLFLSVAGEKIMQGTGNMMLPMIANLTGAVTNIVLDPILIFGLFGLPRMEVAGAAVATVIGQVFGMALNLFFLLAFKHHVHISLSKFRFNASTVKNIYSVGLPSIIMQAIGSVMLVGLNSILIAFSEAAVAVLGIYYKLQSFVFMPVFGLNQGTMPIMGYNYGARNKERLMRAFWLALITALVIMGLGMALFQIFPTQFMMMFNASQEMMSIGVRALRLISLCFLPAAVGIICSTLFQAVGHGMLSLLVSLLRQLILILPMAYVLSRVGGVESVWYAFPLAEIFALIASIIFCRNIYRKEIQPLEDSRS